MVREEIPSPTKQAHVEEESDNDEDEDDADKGQSSITSYEMALHVSNDLQRFYSQNQEEEIAGAIFNVIVKLESAKLKRALNKTKQSSIVQYLKS